MKKGFIPAAARTKEIPWAEDSMFPFKGADSIFVKVSFKVKGGKDLLIEEYVEPEQPEE